MKLKKTRPTPGNLFITCKDNLYISGGENPSSDVLIEKNSIIMFLNFETYEEALKSVGQNWEDLDKTDKEWPALEPFWHCLVKEHKFYLSEKEALECFIAIPIPDSE